MRKSNTSSYLKIYFWQGIAYVLQFVSMFIVIPYLSKEPSIYGIYAVCMSVTIFLNYADMGFLRASQKYATESYIREERIDEMRFIGFGSLILLMFTIVCSLIFFYLGFHPHILIKDLDTPEKFSTASNLLFILAIFTPVTVLKRMVAMIFDIRLASYINQRLLLVGSLITIFSVFYFFRSGSYEIVHYFLFLQIVNFTIVLVSMMLAKRKYNYKFLLLLSYLRFDPIIFKKAKNLAFAGLFGMLTWLLFYEIDPMIIGKFLGSEKVAIYSIAIVFATLFRGIFGIIFGPFMVRANYYVGIGKEEELKKFCVQLISLSAPIIILPTVALALISKPLILSWVGVNYTESINLARLYAFLFSLSFITYPVNMYLVAKVLLRETYIVSAIMPLVYWIGIFLTFSSLGLLSFATFKLLAIVITAFFYLYLSTKYLDFTLKDFYTNVIIPLILPIFFLTLTLLIGNRFLPIEKSKINLLLVIGTTGLSITLSFLIIYFTSTKIRNLAKNIIGNVFKK